MDERAEKEAKREDEERGRAWIGMDGREHHACAQSMRGVGRSRKHIARGRSGFSFMGSMAPSLSYARARIVFPVSGLFELSLFPRIQAPRLVYAAITWGLDLGREEGKRERG